MGDSIQQVNSAYQGLIAQFHDQLLGTYKTLSTNVADQNAQIDSQITKYKNESAPAFQKTKYETESTHQLMTVYTYMIWIFAGLVAIMTVGLYLDTSMGTIEKVIIWAKVATFPLWIYATEQILYMMWKYIYSLATGQVYTNVYLNQY
jgi:hypothetical protein